MEFFDTHAHFGEEDRPFPQWADRAFQAGVTRILLAVSGWANTLESRENAHAVDKVYYSAGIHPHEAETETGHGIAEYETFLTDSKCIAVGEIGLDYYYDISPREKQREVFQGCLDLALKTGKPALIHCRDKEDTGDAYEHMYEHLSVFAAKGGRFELHSFAGSPEWLKKFRDLDAYFGVGGMITFKRAENIRTIARMMPIDRILTETDSPYLAPVPFRGKRNHPALLPHIAGALSECQCVTEEEIARITMENALTFFRIGENE